MKNSELQALIRESIQEVLSEMTPEEWRKKSEEMFAAKPKRPTLSPEEEQQVIQQFKSLPTDKKKAFAWCLKRPCTYCEKEFAVSNVGASHGICKRHQQEIYAQMGKTPKPSSDKGSFDLNNFTPEERVFATKLFAVIDKRHGQRF